jgi:phage shock protein PspC (stress-responsive transcriptional regulator)
MKKALQISIAQTLFTIEEDAYVRLSKYLESVRAHFAKTEGHEEIVSDIEGRIAEQFAESKHSIITLVEVEKVIAAMGHAEDLGGTENETEPQEKTATKKLYRDTDNAVIGGVAAGLAKYLGIDPLWLRIIFLVLLFTTGFGFVLYIILWIAIPEAKTPSQKLEMSGSPVNLGTLSETAKEKIEEVTAKHSGKFKRGLDKFMKAIGAVFAAIIKRIGPVLRITAGIILLIVSIAGLVSLSTAAGALLTMSPDRYVEFPLTEVIPLSHASLMVGAGYLTLLIPLVFVFLLAASMLRRKSIVNAAFGFGLLGVWCIALIAFCVTAFNASLSYSDYVRTNPDYQKITLTIPLEGAVTSLAVTHGTKVTVTEGPVLALSADGRKIDFERYETKLDEGRLTLGSYRKEKNCIFCGWRRVQYTLTVPDLSRIEADSGSSVEASLSTSSFAVEANEGSVVRLTGSATSSVMSASTGSRIEAKQFSADAVNASALYGSSIVLYANKTLDARAEYGSSIEYAGDPTVTKDEKRGSTVEALELEE